MRKRTKRRNARDRIKTRPGPIEDLGEERCRAPRVVATCQHPLFLLMLLLMLCWLLLALLLAGWLLLPLLAADKGRSAQCGFTAVVRLNR